MGSDSHDTVFPPTLHTRVTAVEILKRWLSIFTLTGYVQMLQKPTSASDTLCINTHFLTPLSSHAHFKEGWEYQASPQLKITRSTLRIPYLEANYKLSIEWTFHLFPNSWKSYLLTSSMCIEVNTRYLHTPNGMWGGGRLFHPSTWQRQWTWIPNALGKSTQTLN